MLTDREFATAFPSCPQARKARYFTPLANAMKKAGIVTKRRKAAFLAQLGHESMDLRYFGEIWGPTPAQRRYQGRMGNNAPGDGYRYRGRGPIQLTGKDNYRAASRALGLDLVSNPDLAETPDVGFAVACWFWTSRGLNDKADAWDIRGISRAINGGWNGLAERISRSTKNLAVCVDDEDSDPTIKVVNATGGNTLCQGVMDDFENKPTVWVPIRAFADALHFTIVSTDASTVLLMTETGGKHLPLRIMTVNGQGVGHVPIRALREAFNLPQPAWDGANRVVTISLIPE